MLFDKTIILIDKDRILSKKVDSFHMNGAMELINEYLDSNYNLEEDMKNYNVFFPEVITNKFGIVVILANKFFSAMYIPDNYNSYQLEQIISINNMIKEVRDLGIKYGLAPWYNHSFYYDIDEFLKYNNNLKR